MATGASRTGFPKFKFSGPNATSASRVSSEAPRPNVITWFDLTSRAKVSRSVHDASCFVSASVSPDRSCRGGRPRLSFGRPAPSSPTTATSPEAVTPETFRARTEVFEKPNYMDLMRYVLVSFPGRGLHPDTGQSKLRPRLQELCDEYVGVLCGVSCLAHSRGA